MKQFLAATIAIALLALMSLPVVYFFDAGKSRTPRAAVAAATVAASETKPEASAPWISETEKQHIMAALIERRDADSTSAMIEGMREIAEGLSGLAADSETDDSSLTLVSGTAAAGSRGGLPHLAVDVQQTGQSGQHGSTALVDKSAIANRMNSPAVADEAVPAAEVPEAGVAVAAVSSEAVAVPAAAVAPAQLIVSHFRIPRAAMEIAGSYAGNGYGLTRDYPTSFLWYYIA